MSYSCPLNFERVDSYASRLNSLIVALLVSMYLVTTNELILYFLIIDFMIRLFINKEYSPLAIVALKIRKLLKLEQKFTDGGAKRLAAIFGLMFVGILLLTHLFHLVVLSWIVAVIFLSCSLMDVLLNYCLGCQTYYIMKRIYPSFMS